MEDFTNQNTRDKQQIHSNGFFRMWCGISESRLFVAAAAADRFSVYRRNSISGNKILVNQI